VSVVLSGILGKKNMARMLDALREAPPKEIGGLAVTAFEDLRDERSHLGPIKGATDFASRNVLLFRLGDRARIALRPSGTEPKAKAYIEVCSGPCPAGASVALWQRTCRDVDELANRLARDFLQKALALIGMSPAEAGLR
jgi:phosphoglucomutase